MYSVILMSLANVQTFYIGHKQCSTFQTRFCTNHVWFLNKYVFNKDVVKLKVISVDITSNEYSRLDVIVSVDITFNYQG